MNNEEDEMGLLGQLVIKEFFSLHNINKENYSRSEERGGTMKKETRNPNSNCNGVKDGINLRGILNNCGPKTIILPPKNRNSNLPFAVKQALTHQQVLTNQERPLIPGCL